MQVGLGFATNEVYRQLYGYLLALDVKAIETPIGPDTDNRTPASVVSGWYQVSLHPIIPKTCPAIRLFSLPLKTTPVFNGIGTFLS
jgi:hypothetical protein